MPRRSRCSLPKELVAAVLRFSQENFDLSAGLGACGRCFSASVEFQEVLMDMGLISEEGREKLWDVVKVWVLADGSPLPVDCQQHWVFRYRDVLIDWTARQFADDFAFPEVFKTRNFSPI